MDSGIRQRQVVEETVAEKWGGVKDDHDTVSSTLSASPPPILSGGHPAGDSKHVIFMQVLRGITICSYFLLCVVSICITQLAGAWLYWYNQDLYYSYMAMTKQHFALVATTVTQWWGPTLIRISGDESVADQLHTTEDGRVEFHFPERLVLIANHQIYTDWLYLWWVAYANNPQLHGHIYIILKESLRYVPLLGTGMMFYGFIFMSRKMSTDQPRLAHRLQKLSQRHAKPGVDGTGSGNDNSFLSPMWLLLFPEGTNVCANSQRKSVAWATKTGVPNPQHMLLPRSTGTYFCLKELDNTVEYVYDCTVAYEGIPRGRYGEDFFTIGSTYIQGRPPKSVNFYWRRFRVADIPLDTPEAFDDWLRARWYEKDAFMEQYLVTGRFPPGALGGNSAEATTTASRTSSNTTAFTKQITHLNNGYIETTVRMKRWAEVFQMFTVPLTLLLVARIIRQAYQLFDS